ncbi:MAG TPA: NAD(P)-dependent oxidoreductase [Jatrophihabitans sp.]|nr:NAD(P)-dependent oxidoreductase [Jatrophihabitans sp.]
MTVVGVVGLGSMGGEIAGRLIAAGHEVHGTNRTRGDRAKALIARGLTWHDTPREVAGAVEVVISMVTDDVALNAVAGGPDGILAGLSPSTVYVDMSSVSQTASVSLADQVRSIGSHMLDAPVSGSVPQVQAGSLAIMVGGEEATFDQVEPLLAQLGRTVTRVGDNGAGVLLKLAINISLAVQVLAFSEGLLLAQSGGLDPRLAADVMGNSPIGSPMLKTRIPLLLDLPDDAWFTIQLMHKDIRLALAEAHRAAVALPSAAVAGAVLSRAEELGYGGQDIAGLREVLGKISEQAVE